MQQTRSGRNAVRWSSALLLAFAFSAAVAAQPAPAYELRRGVVIEQGRGAAYVSSPGGGIEAVDLSSGRSLWRSANAALPLASNGQLLVAQAEDVPATSRLRVTIFDVAAGGRELAVGSAPLPDDVRALITDRLGRRFRVKAAPEGDGFLITWTYREVPLLSTARPPGERLPERNFEGAFRLAPTGQLVPVDSGLPALRATVDATARQVMRANDLREAPWRAGAILAAVQGGRGEALTLLRWDAATGAPLAQQKLSSGAIAALPSSDREHVLASERVGEGGPDDPEYRWSIFSLETGERIGELRRDVSAAPFTVFKETIVFESQPFGYRRGEVWIDEPMSIRAVRTTTGVPVWSHEIRDLEYRGPVPPSRH